MHSVGTLSQGAESVVVETFAFAEVERALGKIMKEQRS
jgi:hypothetical protein